MHEGIVEMRTWPVVKRYLVRFTRVLFAALLLYWDQRAFLLYAFLLLLAGLERLERLRAIGRVFHHQNAVKLAVMLEKMEISREALVAMAVQTKGEMSREDWKALEDDIVLALRG